MKRLVAAFLLSLALAAPVAAAPPNQYTATLSVDDPTPVWGQFITLTTTTDAPNAQIYMECVHVGGTSVSHSPYGTGTFSDDVGLYAPNWPEGAAAECTAETRSAKFSRSGKTRYETLVTLTFSVTGS